MWKEKKEVESWKKRLILRLQAPKLLLIFYDFFPCFTLNLLCWQYRNNDQIRTQKNNSSINIFRLIFIKKSVN